MVYGAREKLSLGKIDDKERPDKEESREAKRERSTRPAPVTSRLTFSRTSHFFAYEPDNNRK